MMSCIYRISLAPDAPCLKIAHDQPYAHLFAELRGEQLSPASPDRSFLGHLSELRSWRQFYRVAPGGFAISEEAWINCEDMYYIIAGNYIEVLSVKTEEVNMRVVNPLQFLPPSHDPSMPCDLDYVPQLFRISGRPKTELFCFEGTEVPDDEFKSIYDRIGFEGLVFEEIWRGEYTRVK